MRLGLALAFEPAEEDVMARPPRPAREALLSAFLLWRTGFVALLLLAGTFGLFVAAETGGRDLGGARDRSQHAGRVRGRLPRQLPAPAGERRQPVGPLGSRAVLIAIAIGLQLLFTYGPPLQLLFASAPPGWRSWVRIVLAALLAFALVELEKAWQRRAGATTPRASSPRISRRS